MKLSHVKEGIKILVKSYERRINGMKHYKGGAKAICKRIVSDCFNGDYLMTSAGHFSEFWTRDFGWCTESLLNQGYKEWVLKTLKYALKVFWESGGAKTTINPVGESFNYPYYAADTLPWLTHSLRLLGNKSLINKYGPFIESEANNYLRIVMDEKKGLVKNASFSSIKDYARRNSSTYDNTMALMLKNDLDSLGLNNPLQRLNIKESMIKHLWTGNYWRDDLDYNELTADANIFPYITGCFTNESMIKSSIKSITNHGLEKPLPVKYSLCEIKNPIINYFFVKNYQGTTIWTHMGPLFIKLVKQAMPEQAVKYEKDYGQMIERFSNYPEVLNNDLTPYMTKFYTSDESMLWAVNFLDL